MDNIHMLANLWGVPASWLHISLTHNPTTQGHGFISNGTGGCNCFICQGISTAINEHPEDGFFVDVGGI